MVKDGEITLHPDFGGLSGETSLLRASHLYLCWRVTPQPFLGGGLNRLGRWWAVLGGEAVTKTSNDEKESSDTKSDPGAREKKINLVFKEKKKDFFIVLGRSSTKKILEFLDSHKNVQLDDLTQFATSFTLKKLVQELMKFNLIKCYVQMDNEKKVWYELTEKGEKILQALRELERILRSSYKDGGILG